MELLRFVSLACAAGEHEVLHNVTCVGDEECLS
jgi:hypothetical protein